MLTAAGSPLVAGAPDPTPMKTVNVKVMRPFLVRGQRQEVGAVLEVDRVLAGELTSAGKAVVVPPKASEVKAEPKPVKEKTS